MRTAIALLALGLVCPPAAFAVDDPMPSYARVVGDKVFIMVRPGPGKPMQVGNAGAYAQAGLYRNDGSTMPLWRVTWYAKDTKLSEDGRFLVRVDSAPTTRYAPALVFYDRGRELARYSLEDLGAANGDGSWLDSAALDDATKKFGIRATGGQTHSFDLTSGGRLLGEVIDATKLRAVALNEAFSLAVGERVAVPEADLLIELTDLRYVTCPPGELCSRPSGPLVQFRVVEISTSTEIQHGTERGPLPNRFPHFARQITSDGKTYVQFAVHASAEFCRSRASQAEKRTCWSRLAELTADPAHCANIPATGLSPDVCYATLAQELDRPELCEHVTATNGWCGFVKTRTETDDPRKCGQLTPDSRRTECVSAAAARYGKDICRQLPWEQDRATCFGVFGENLREPHAADRDVPRQEPNRP